MMTRDLDKLARGPGDPRARVQVPRLGDRCPRCHRRWRAGPCLLCAPDLVPEQFRP